jgi:hypothetical protein
LSANCPRCARPVAAAQPRCVYCGAELPPEAVEQAAAARASLEAEWAREATPAGPAEAPATPRVLLVLPLEGAAEDVLARALRLSAFEAAQRRRRGGPELHRILAAPQAAEEAARLRGHGLSVLEIAEEEVRPLPVCAARGGPDAEALALESAEGPLRVSASDLLLLVRGTIAREYLRPPAPLRRLSVASLEPGFRFHLHRRSHPRPIELDPAAFDFGPGGAPAGAQRQITAWIDALYPAAPRDDSFRFVIPALAPAAGSGAGDPLEALARAAREARPLLDNLAQFRFHSAWRAAARRRAPG